MLQPVIKISVSHSQDSVSTLTFIFATTRTYRPNVPRFCLCCLLYHGGDSDQSLPLAFGASPELPLLPALDRTLKITRSLGEQRQRELFVLLRSRCGNNVSVPVSTGSHRPGATLSFSLWAF